ncbi:MAG: hypothetical protein JRM86_04100 [Nitrososphaerota archaeon]|nr:hypothetical protein [Nitrososphaerota archaeon]MDG6966464.1 hypothetical protein [Nitrososphaerota archaeon]MDG6979156.1 hypothetical protein [Nitrososphaerota archaeon]MDG7006095.1 hypothetical protein [Nitrososphaerota archaeon]
MQSQSQGGAVGSFVVGVDTRIQRVSLSRDAAGQGPAREGQFAFDVSMTETGRTRGSLSVSYTLSFGRQSTGQRCRIDGEAVFRLSGADKDSDIHAFGTEIDNEMAVAVFREDFETIYLLHQTLGVQAPSPWVTQDVSLSSRGVPG